MKFKYDVPLEILRIIGSVLQIFDAKLSFKTSQEVEWSRKNPYEKRSRIVEIFGSNESPRSKESKTGFRKTNGQDLGGVLWI